MFVDRLIDKILDHKNCTVVGLDPRAELMPETIISKALESENSYAKGIAEAFYQFNKEIIDNIYDIVPAVKPQIAFYERFGVDGFNAYIKTCEYAKQKGMIVIGDVKRSDIGSTAEAYSDFYLGVKEYSLHIDSITVNPYLGRDSLEPFMKNCYENNKGIFILVKTSNKSSVDIQDLICEGRKVYEHVADIVVELGESQIGRYGYSLTGAVVGATFSEDSLLLRRIMKKNYFLVPGYGAQGAAAKDIVHCFNEDGLGAIVNSSRDIIFAYKNEKYNKRFLSNQFGLAARQSAIDMQNEINNELRNNNKLAW